MSPKGVSRTLPRSADLAERLMVKTDRRPGGCWIWQGGLSQDGYGLASWGGRTQAAHRAVYELLVEPISEGLELDHLCRNRPCVNPVHLEPVTHAENMRRSSDSALRDRHEDAHDLLLPAEAREILRVGPTTIRKAINDGQFDFAIRRIGQQTYLSREALMRWISTGAAS